MRIQILMLGLKGQKVLVRYNTLLHVFVYLLPITVPVRTAAVNHLSAGKCEGRRNADVSSR